MINTRDNKKYIALIGLGAIGSPLAHLLYKKYGDRFIILADKKIASDLKKQTIYINGYLFSPRIVTPDEKIDRPIEIVFVCVKNYSLESALNTIKPLLDSETLILPLQNGVYSYDFFRKELPENVILEGYAQGPNTRIYGNNIVFQNPGEYHFGKQHENFKSFAEDTYTLLKSAEIPCVLEDDIRRSIWKKMMLNVAGNALTALTELDYIMFKNSPEAKALCVKLMKEYTCVAEKEGIKILSEDIDEIIEYFTGYNKSKRTSMLEDVLNKRETENEYLAGYICMLAKKHNIEVPTISTLYSLMKIKEDVYLGKLN